METFDTQNEYSVCFGLFWFMCFALCVLVGPILLLLSLSSSLLVHAGVQRFAGPIPYFIRTYEEFLRPLC